ncbi:MAG: hypothetical protein HW401_628 [Parcubacteria group bacterium]|nr:hypothetical protein [Parcubacteria group bacterium]
MVKRVFKIFHKEISGLHEAAYLLAFFAILSQLLGLIRDRLLAYSFGAGSTLDIYYAAFRIPDFIFVTIASVVSISVLVPFLIEKLDQSIVLGKKFIDNIFSFFFILISGVSLLAYFLMPYLVPLIFSGLNETDKMSELITIARILLLSPIFLGLSNFFASITQVYRRFLIYGLSPIFYNIGIIIGILFLYPIFGLKGLVFGVILGAIFHFSIQIPFVRKQGLIPRFSFSIDYAEIRRVVFLSIPRTITLGIHQIGLIFLISFASRMVEGSISVFTFSLNLQSVPLSIIGVSYSIAAFPTLSRLFSSGQRDSFLGQIIASSRHVIFWCMPRVANYFGSGQVQLGRHPSYGRRASIIYRINSRPEYGALVRKRLLRDGQYEKTSLYGLVIRRDDNFILFHSNLGVQQFSNVPIFY